MNDYFCFSLLPVLVKAFDKKWTLFLFVHESYETMMFGHDFVACFIYDYQHASAELELVWLLLDHVIVVMS